MAPLLPGRQGRLLFAYLVLNRTRAVPREELAEVLWPRQAPPAATVAMRALLSKLRGLLGDGALEGREEVRLRLPAGALIDVEAASAAIHRAESALLQGDYPSAWGPAQVALFTARRGFFPGEDAPWIEESRRDLEEIELRALEAYGRSCLGIGGTELPAAERSGRALVRRSPYRESGHRLLIESLAAAGNAAEALAAYEALRCRLREELGIVPSPPLRELHQRLLGAG
jgi:DNA-binding SARP family transcriptional activator